MKLEAWLWLCLFGTAWGLSIPLSKTALSTGYAPIGVIFWQFSTGLVLLGIIVMVKRIRLPLDRHSMFFYLGLALVGTLIPNTASFTAYANLPAGIVAIVIATVPMFALVGALLLRQERFDTKRGMGILLGVMALMLIALPETSLPGETKLVFVFVALLAAMGYGLEGPYIARYEPAKINPMASLMMASVLGAPLAAGLAWMRGDFIPISPDMSVADMAMFAQSALHVIAYSGFIWLVGRYGPVFTSQIAYVVTVVGVLSSAYFLGEVYAGTIWLALILMVVGLRLVQPKLGSTEVEGSHL